MKFQSKKSGFTLVEIVIATLVLILLTTFAFSVYTDYFNSLRNLEATNLVYQETRFAMERVIQEVREKTIDYEEYFDKSSFLSGTPDTYGDNYCKYSRQFYSPGVDDQYGTKDDKNTGVSQEGAALKSSVQNELYLINGSGRERTYIKRIQEQDSAGNPIGRIGMVKLLGMDYGLDRLPANPALGRARDEGEEDGFVDTWVCHPDFPCGTDGNGAAVIQTGTFLPITPAQLNVLDAKFFLAPADDPRKGFNMDAIQIQPHVTIKLIVAAGPRIAQTYRGDALPSITLESTVSSRVYTDVEAECVLKECENGEEQVCPRDKGVCKDATQICQQNVWPGCNEEAYRAAVLRAFTDDVYEHLQETTCDDDLDNDCDGLADEFDPDCVQILCINGTRDTGLAPADYEPKDDLTEAVAPNEFAPNNQDERCKDIGGICDNIHTYEPNGETSCSDGYDNDCNFDPGQPGTGADEFDQACIDLICDDGEQTIGLAGTDTVQRDWLIGADPGVGAYNQDEIAADIGGLCVNASNPKAPEPVEVSCSDGLNNDPGNNPLADEFDPNCALLICANNAWDRDLAPPEYEPKDNLTGYADASFTKASANDEECRDAGGICGPLAENTVALCADGIDNDCDTFQDHIDRDCCPDATSDSDSDGFKLAGGLCQPPLEEVDCDDTNASVHPPHDPPRTNELESGNAMCDDGLDNDCRDGADGADPKCCTDTDGDTYGGVADNLKSCSGSTTEADCDDLNPAINPGRMEICDDSTENDCDGLQDLDDDYCMTLDELTIIDNLSSTVWKNALTTAVWDGSGLVTNPAPTGEFIAVSKILPITNLLDCPGITHATVRSVAEVPVGGSIRYQLTNNENAWIDAPVNDEIAFSEFKRKLRWRAFLEGNGSLSPEIDRITVEYRCD